MLNVGRWELLQPVCRARWESFLAIDGVGLLTRSGSRSWIWCTCCVSLPPACHSSLSSVCRSSLSPTAVIGDEGEGDAVVRAVVGVVPLMPLPPVVTDRKQGRGVGSSTVSGEDDGDTGYGLQLAVEPDRRGTHRCRHAGRLGFAVGCLTSPESRRRWGRRCC
ncbi:hypothetical protein ACLOJK_017382 [Asimina triloba]